MFDDIIGVKGTEGILLFFRFIRKLKILHGNIFRIVITIYKHKMSFGSMKNFIEEKKNSMKREKKRKIGNILYINM